MDDDASEVLTAEFVEHESFFAYAKLCKSYFQTTSTPVTFYNDKFSVFRANSIASVNKDAITQFSRAVGSLRIKLICAVSSQAKGCVERANQTFQDRLVKELGIRQINYY